MVVHSFSHCSYSCFCFCFFLSCCQSVEPLMTLSETSITTKRVCEPKVAEEDIRHGHETKRNDSVSLRFFARTEKTSYSR